MSAVFIPGEHYLLVVVEQVARVVPVRVNLVQVAEKFVEAVLPRHSLGADVAQPPLAEHARGIASLLENVGDGGLAGKDRRALRYPP